MMPSQPSAQLHTDTIIATDLQKHFSVTRAVLAGMLLLGCLLAALPHTTRADEAAKVPVDQLERFIRGLSSFQASFEQTLYDAESRPMQTSSGTIRLKRPGRFIWSYTSPQPQTIVADGERVWLYDEDLEQVTVNRLDERINGTPLEILMSEAPLSDAFEIESLGQAESIDWFVLIPLTPSADFEELYLGLRNDSLAAMELRDSFGQATQIRLSDFEQNIAFDDAVFEFAVPDGVDVIGLDE